MSAVRSPSPLVCCRYLQGVCPHQSAPERCRFTHSDTDPAPCQHLHRCYFHHERRLWQLDDHAASCYLCGLEFSVARRRHHCRRCGRCVDSDCLVDADGPAQLKTCMRCRGTWTLIADGEDGSEQLYRDGVGVPSGTHWSQAILSAGRGGAAPGDSHSGLVCSVCHAAKAERDFSHTQRRKEAGKRKCKACVDGGGAQVKVTPLAEKPTPVPPDSTPGVRRTKSPPPPRFEMQIVSDVHLEFGRKEDDPIQPFLLGEPTAPYLAICGDLTVNHAHPSYQTQLEAYIGHLVGRYQTVFYVMGNHCVWYSSIAAATEKFRVLERKFGGKFVLLDMDSYDIDGTDVRLLGCTLWANFTDAGFQLLRGVEGQGHMMNDFKYIHDFDVATFRGLHAKHAAWLEAECQRATTEKKQIVVLTHHAPFVDNLVPNVAFGAKLLQSGCLGTDMIGPGSAPGRFNTVRFPGLRCWLYGHTHLCKQFHYQGIFVASNQMGYPQDRDSWRLWGLTTAYPGFRAFDPRFKISV